MGSTRGLFEGISTTLADTLFEVAGNLMVRTYVDQAVGTADLQVDGLHRWPEAGRVIIERESYTYSSITRSIPTNVLHGLTHSSGAVGLIQDTRKGSIVAYFGGDFTDLDKMAASFFVHTAEGSDLDLYARNFGLFRPRGMTDEMFRDLLMVMVFLDATTFYAVEKVLEALVGAGNFEVWDTPRDPEDHHKVFVLLDPEPSDVYRGKTFLCGAEEQTATGAFTVDTTYEPTEVYGVYERVTGDPATDRLGDNHLLVQYSGYTDPALPQFLQTVTDTFTVDDTGRSVIFPNDGSIWTIVAFSNARAVQLSRPDNEGSVSVGSPQRLVSDGRVFRSWMVGATVTITNASNAGNYQTGTILAVHSTGVVELAGMSGGGWVASDSDIVFAIAPDFTSAGFPFQILRYSLAGTTITAQNTLPTDLFVDYATIPSAELCTDFRQSGEEQYPFYLYDDTWYVSSILDLILAAGCHPVVERTY